MVVDLCMHCIYNVVVVVVEINFNSIQYKKVSVTDTRPLLLALEAAALICVLFDELHFSNFSMFNKE